MIEYHSHIGHTAYTDLLRSLKDETVTDIRGTPTRMVRNGRTYWYDSYRIGSDVKKTYIGEESPELLDRLDRLAEIRRDSSARKKRRSELIKHLRAEDYQFFDKSVGSLLSAFANSGVFRLGGTLVGATAFRCYEGELGAKMNFGQLARTNDIDIASFERLSLALEDTESPSLQKTLRDFSFVEVPSLHKQKVYRWRQSQSDLSVEFLTNSLDDVEGVRELKALGIHSQALHYLNYLIADPIYAVVLYRSGVLVKIPQPEKFAIHKLIVAERQKDGPDGLKSRKDRMQSSWLTKILASDRPDQLHLAFEDAMNRGPKWRQLLEKSLKKVPEVRSNLESAKLHFES